MGICPPSGEVKILYSSQLNRCIDIGRASALALAMVFNRTVRKIFLQQGGDTVVIILLWIVVVIFVVPAVFQWLWNMTCPQVFDLSRITYWQAFRLLIMAGLLFGEAHLLFQSGGGGQEIHIGF